MENTDKKECSCQGGCSCGMGYMHGCHGRYHLVRMILRIVIVILIFWCGYRLGNDYRFYSSRIRTLRWNWNDRCV